MERVGVMTTRGGAIAVRTVLGVDDCSVLCWPWPASCTVLIAAASLLIGIRHYVQ